MASTKSIIPRFLLPQLTWRATLPRTLATTNPHTPFFTTPYQHHRTQSHLVRTPRRPTPSLSSRPQTRSEAQLTQTIYSALVSSIRGTSPRLSPLELSSSRFFSTTRPLLRDHHFDTLKFVQRLKDEGFSEEQATALMRILGSVIEESIQNLTRTMVLREDAERAAYTQKVDFTKLRSELLSSDSAEAQLTRASHERLTGDLAKLNARLRDEIGRTQASVKLDLNLEKGRIREEANSQDLKVKETGAKIEQEVAGLRERMDNVKFATLQWLMGVCTGTAALILGAWRLLM